MKIKIKDGFIVRQIAENWIVVPTGERVADVNGIISLSDSAAYLWTFMVDWTTEEEILEKLTDEYEIDTKTAKKDISALITSLREKKLIEE